MAKQIFDYSKYSSTSVTYYGFHFKKGRCHIDTKRLKKIRCDGSFPTSLFTTTRNTHYFIPKYQYKNEWSINVLRSYLNRLTTDWNTEYKTAISKLTTTKEVEDQVRMDGISGTCDAEGIEEAEFNATIAGIKRTTELSEVIRGIHLQYIHKIFVDYFRAMLNIIKRQNQRDYSRFSFGDVCEYVNEVFSIDDETDNPLYKLPHYKYFALLNKVDNFLKHNTLESYNYLVEGHKHDSKEIKAFQASYVVKPEERELLYESGMYAGDWLKITPTFIDEILSNLKAFSEEFCELVFDEDPDESKWNSDEYLIEILKENYIN